MSRVSETPSQPAAVGDRAPRLGELEHLDMALGRLRRVWDQPAIRAWVADGLDLDELDASIFRTLRAVRQLGPDGASVNGVADLLRIDASTASRFLDRARAAGYAERSSSPTDRRKSLFTLTADGRKQLLRVRTRRLELLGQLTESWSVDDIEQLIELLARLDDAVMGFGLGHGG